MGVCSKPLHCNRKLLPQTKTEEHWSKGQTVPSSCSTSNPLSLSNSLLTLIYWALKSSHCNSSTGLMHLDARALLTEMGHVCICSESRHPQQTMPSVYRVTQASPMSDTTSWKSTFQEHKCQVGQTASTWNWGHNWTILCLQCPRIPVIQIWNKKMCACMTFTELLVCVFVWVNFVALHYVH